MFIVEQKRKGLFEFLTTIEGQLYPKGTTLSFYFFGGGAFKKKKNSVFRTNRDVWKNKKKQSIQRTQCGVT